MPPHLDADRLMRDERAGFAELRWLVDRTSDRREVWRRLDPELATANPVGHARNIVFLTGAKDTGKVHAGQGVRVDRPAARHEGRAR